MNKGGMSIKHHRDHLHHRSEGEYHDPLPRPWPPDRATDNESVRHPAVTRCDVNDSPRLRPFDCDHVVSMNGAADPYAVLNSWGFPGIYDLLAPSPRFPIPVRA